MLVIIPITIAVNQETSAGAYKGSYTYDIVVNSNDIISIIPKFNKTNSGYVFEQYLNGHLGIKQNGFIITLSNSDRIESLGSFAEVVQLIRNQL